MLRTLEFALLAVSAIVFLGLVIARPVRRSKSVPEEHAPFGAGEVKVK